MQLFLHCLEDYGFAVENATTILTFNSAMLNKVNEFNIEH
jgi:hypothetical protein